jgi:hypothetical protein
MRAMNLPRANMQLSHAYRLFAHEVPRGMGAAQIFEVQSMLDQVLLISLKP